MRTKSNQTGGRSRRRGSAICSARRPKILGWWEEYHCTCTSETVRFKKDLLGYCKHHLENRRNIFPVFEKVKAPNDKLTDADG
jgi:hypothetical protein